ncbi:MAG TPA: DUF3467 domain-containing protein [Acidimicrobiia bacterium]|jgi:hypothetical protein|nr:DUF3467 domain-containing protein [Acidimicrobiia bacterium]
MSSEPQVRFEMSISENEVVGVYSNFLGVWHTPHEFTLDFAVTQPAMPGTDEDGNAVTRVPCQVVARVRVPPTVLFDFLRTINENLSNYESSFGSIQRPDTGGIVYPPDE